MIGAGVESLGECEVQPSRCRRVLNMSGFPVRRLRIEKGLDQITPGLRSRAAVEGYPDLIASSTLPWVRSA
jgi:hypothetical protein